nr:TetR/AcrR family transcriptional regulator C-terminal domain-containing protein [Micromonospora sp. DSM 115978]
MAARTTREPLSRERVLAAAVALADTEGIKALTMRRLAADLGVEAMSLYYHLPAKEALLDGVVETVVAEIAAAVDRVRPIGGGAGDDGAVDAGGTGRGAAGDPVDGGAAGDPGVGGADWRARLRRQFLAARQVMLRHPWVPGLLSTRRTIPASVFAYYDGILGTMVDAGFSYRIAHRALHAFGSMPLGFAQELFSPSAAGGSMDPDASEAEMAAMADALPHLAAMVASEIHDATDPTLGWCDSQVEFEFTLNLLLDGLERLR